MCAKWEPAEERSLAVAVGHVVVRQVSEFKVVGEIARLRGLWGLRHVGRVRLEITTIESTRTAVLNGFRETKERTKHFISTIRISEPWLRCTCAYL